jgi:hypothetical protein
VEDEDNVVFHLCLSNRKIVEEDEVSRHVSHHMLLLAVAVGLATLEVSP